MAKEKGFIHPPFLSGYLPWLIIFFLHFGFMKKIEPGNMDSGDCQLTCWWLIWPIQNDVKDLKNDWNPDTDTSESTQELSNE